MNAEQEGRELAEHLVSVDDGVIRQLREEVSEVYREEIAQLRQQIVERDQRIEQLARWVREERVAKGLSEEKLGPMRGAQRRSGKAAERGALGAGHAEAGGG
jgi:hypothetical protein